MQNRTGFFIILFLSLLLNAFLLGGQTFQPQHPPFSAHGLHAGPHEMMENALPSLPADKREEISKLIDDHEKITQHDVAELHKMFHQLKPILTDTAFDAAKLHDVQIKMDKVDDKLKQDMSDMIAAVATTLPDDERITFFKAALPDDMPPPPGGSPPRHDMPAP